MAKNTKLISLLFLVGALVSLIFLSASLSNLQLQAGTPFPSGSNSGNDTQFSSIPASVQVHSLTLLKGLFSLFFLILAIDVSVRLVALVNIKRTLILFLALVILFLIVISIPPVAPGRAANPPAEISEVNVPPSFEYPTSPLGKPPQVFVWLVILGLVLGVSFLTIKILKQQSTPTRIEDQLFQEAEAAVNAIKAGGDLRNVIIRCYLQMADALQEERGIVRSYSMTVQEFEELLALKGFPTLPVHQLTSLFEKIRYGKQPTVKDDERTAIVSLDEIIRFCQSDIN